LFRPRQRAGQRMRGRKSCTPCCPPLFNLKHPPYAYYC
jgi:hypothetical protein